MNTSNNEFAIEVLNAKKVYPLGSSEVLALKGVTIKIKAGEFTTIAGPSGCGKSTLLNLIGCMDKPTEGKVLIEGESTQELSDQKLTELRLQKLGFIFQSFNLIPVLSVFQNVEFPLLLQAKLNGAERKEIVENLLREVGLQDHMINRANELSGGQRQRVAVARALVTNPKIVLADEPTANLDSATGEKIIDLMKEINETHGTTFVFSTHDPHVMEHASRIIRLKDGLLVTP